jgi:hypothetical protein
MRLVEWDDGANKVTKLGTILPREVCVPTQALHKEARFPLYSRNGSVRAKGETEHSDGFTRRTLQRPTYVALADEASEPDEIFIAVTAVFNLIDERVSEVHAKASTFKCTDAVLDVAWARQVKWDKRCLGSID